SFSPTPRRLLASRIYPHHHPHPPSVTPGLTRGPSLAVGEPRWLNTSKHLSMGPVLRRGDSRCLGLKLAKRQHLKRIYPSYPRPKLCPHTKPIQPRMDGLQTTVARGPAALDRLLCASGAGRLRRAINSRP